MHQATLFTQGQKIDKAKRAMILLHGRGATADDILTLAPKLCDNSYYIAAPQAAHNSWYPYSFMAEDKLNEPWLSSAVSVVEQLIKEIAQHIPKEEIYLVGFSQGACLSLEVGARHAARFGGIVAFSGGLIGSILDKEKYEGDFKKTPIFIGISDKDPHIPLIRSKESAELLRKMGAEVTLKIYPGMGHTVTQDEISWVKEFITG